MKRRRKAEIDENRKLGLVFDTDPAHDPGNRIMPEVKTTVAAIKMPPVMTTGNERGREAVIAGIPSGLQSITRRRSAFMTRLVDGEFRLAGLQKNWLHWDRLTG